jgi:hypothetical protein
MKDAGIIEQPEYHAQLSGMFVGFLRSDGLIVVMVAHQEN